MPRIITESNNKPYRCQVAITRGAVVVEGTLDGDVTLPGAADVITGIVGVAMEAGAIGDIIAVAGIGSYVPCIAGAAIARGARVSVNDTAGRVKTAAPAAGVNVGIIGVTTQAAAALNDEVTVVITLGTFQG